MEQDLVAQLSALAHPQRLALFRLLMRRYPDRLRAGEIGQVLGARPSTQSAWLSDLAEAGLIDAERRGTQLLYRARLDPVRGMLGALAGDVARGRADPPPPPPPGRVRNVLFLGTANAARSLMAEALLRDIAERRFEAFSAGIASHGAPNPQAPNPQAPNPQAPNPQAPNPQALTMLGELGHDTGALWSKPVADFLTDQAPRMDIVITLCNAAANRDLPVWPGQPVQGHWGLPDPVATGSADTYAEVYLTLRARLAALAGLPGDLPRDRLQAALNDLALIRATSG